MEDYPDFGAARLSEPVDRYIKQFGNPVTESEALAMIAAVDPTLDEYEAREHADAEFHFTRPSLGNDWDSDYDEDSEDRWTTIVPLAKLLAVPPRGQDASLNDVTSVAIFWQQLQPVIQDWEFPEGGTEPYEDREGGKVTPFGIAALHLWQAQMTWVTALAQWMSAAHGKLSS